MANPVSLYIYYRVPLAHLLTLADAASAMQAELCRQTPGLTAQLMRRPKAQDGQVTVMETYHHVSGVDSQVEAAINEAAKALSGLIAGSRQVEHFAPLSV